MVSAHGKQQQQQQEHIVEVPASSKSSEVIAAVIAAAQESHSRSTSSKWLQIMFAGVVMFGLIIYFREEIWAFGRDVQRHPLMAQAEQMQIQHYLGTQWLFGTKKDQSG
mmetsp:Transcript_23249/g.64241  ORF Transcript_23249/g.64241 Transcript_23249/m.64241 type:complete len:109 (-) Transcript_23249:410-736(-)|eukprot:CAMPEP_0202359122 /NCGR_PEP_ID=MMETSP1126-20121109/12529_1 /ASSEMBLY_ACC=CAM_ASM_000457 /TAXON_ID=3047 /ORGANISM="Dunaliella tertiolecta, Strain CCMP1320" /LENGTH=108 /DNA_ID=CAMNT_0048952447 /DNA_START=101 /DNA_END=427 /DNA_ORIENTATION=+